MEVLANVVALLQHTYYLIRLLMLEFKPEWYVLKLFELLFMFAYIISMPYIIVCICTCINTFKIRNRIN